MAYEDKIALALLFAGLIWVCLKLAFELDQVHAALKTFFILLSSIFIIAFSAVGLQLATDAAMPTNIISTMQVLLYVSVFVMVGTMLYFIVYWIGQSMLYAASMNPNLQRGKRE